MLNNTDNEIQSVPDDEFENVTGGTNAKEVAAQAAADGRTFQLPMGNWGDGLCLCAVHNKWAAKKETEKIGLGYGITYYDVKCYKCGKVWDKYII